MAQVPVISESSNINEVVVDTSSINSDLLTSIDKVKSLQYLNPEYSDNLPKWEKYVDCYLARDIYGRIKQHPREHNDIFAKRVERAYYLNYCDSIVNLYASYLFASGITRQSNGELKKEFDVLYQNANRAGMSYDLFIDTVGKFAMTCGHVGVLIDAPPVPENGFASKQDEENAGWRPYLSLVLPQQILDWELDENDKFEWVKIEVDLPSNRSWDSDPNVKARHFLIWTKTSWEHWKIEEDKAVWVDGNTHDLNVVPLVIVKGTIRLGHKWFGESVIRDISDINVAILNWSSMADEEINNRCLNILAMQRDDTDAAIEISQYNVLEYEEGAEPPQYLTPGETPLKLIGEWIDRARDEIYRLAKMGGSTGLLGVREATSGIAYAFEFNETNQSLTEKALLLEEAEKDIHKIFAKWYGKESDAEVQYPREFGVADLLLELQILTQCRSTLTSDTAIKEQEKRTMAKWFAKSSQDLRQKIADEIEKSPAKDMLGSLTQPMNFKTVARDQVGPAAVGSKPEKSEKRTQQQQDKKKATAE